jgi:hypothetical protein
LATLVCTRKGWTLASVHFYTGIPSETDSPDWHLFWKRRLTVLGTRGVETCSRPLSYQTHRVRLSDGTIRSIRIGREKGIDVRLALDIVRMARAGTFDVALVSGSGPRRGRDRTPRNRSHTGALDQNGERVPDESAGEPFAGNRSHGLVADLAG